MKAIVLAAVLAGAGGAAIALLAAPRPAVSAAPVPGTDPGGTLAAALASLEREVAALRREIREGAPLRAGPAGSGAGPGEAPIRSPRTVDGEAPAAAAAVVRSPGAAVPSSGSLAERIAPVRGWDRNAETRARWTFLSEAEVLERFGVPDTVVLEGEAERWNYRVPAVDDEGNPCTDQVILVLNRGRLVTVYD